MLYSFDGILLHWLSNLSFYYFRQFLHDTRQYFIQHLTHTHLIKRQQLTIKGVGDPQTYQSINFQGLYMNP